MSFIRQAAAAESAVAALLPGLAPKPREETLEDAFMMLLRQHEHNKQRASVQTASNIHIKDGLPETPAYRSQRIA